VVLALPPVKSVQAKSMAEQVDALALTVWPTLLSPTIEADAVLIQRDTKAAQLQPQSGEDARTYLQRLCGGLLASDCKQVVPSIRAPSSRRSPPGARWSVSATPSPTA